MSHTKIFIIVTHDLIWFDTDEQWAMSIMAWKMYYIYVYWHVINVKRGSGLFAHEYMSPRLNVNRHVNEFIIFRAHRASTILMRSSKSIYSEYLQHRTGCMWPGNIHPSQLCPQCSYSLTHNEYRQNVPKCEWFLVTTSKCCSARMYNNHRYIYVNWIDINIYIHWYKHVTCEHSNHECVWSTLNPPATAHFRCLFIILSYEDIE